MFARCRRWREMTSVLDTRYVQILAPDHFRPFPQIIVSLGIV